MTQWYKVFHKKKCCRNADNHTPHPSLIFTRYCYKLSYKNKNLEVLRFKKTQKNGWNNIKQAEKPYRQSDSSGKSCRCRGRHT